MKNAIINKWFRAALDGTNVVSFVLDENLRFLAVINPIVLGNEDFYIGKTPRELFAGNRGADELIAAYDRVMTHGEVVKVEIEVKDIWFENILRPTELPDGKIGVLGIATDITRQKIILREQAHRTKNAFTMAMAMASHTARGLDVPVEFKTKLHARLEALSKSQDAVSRGSGMGTTFHTLLESQIGHAVAEDPKRFDICAGDCFINADLAQYVTLAIYELYTNAVKYGALSKESGKVMIDCKTKDDHLYIVWSETGGPTPVEASVGFGRMLVTKIIPQAARGAATFDLKPTGLVWEFSAPQCSAR